MWHGALLQFSSDRQLLQTHDLLAVPRPANQALVSELREHARQFLDTVIPLSPVVISESLIEETVNFLFDALPDLLVEVAIDVAATHGRATEQQLYEQFYAALLEVEEENPYQDVYDMIDEPTVMEGGYVQTTAEAEYDQAEGGFGDPTYDHASSTVENPYHLAQAHNGGEAVYSFATGASEDNVYSRADGHDLGHRVANGEPQYAPADAQDPTYSMASPSGAEPAYSLAASLSEPTYAFASGMGDETADAEPTYAFAGDLGESRDDGDPVYDISDDTA